MPVTMVDAVDFTKVAAINFVVPMVTSDPPVYEGGLIYNTTEDTLKYANGTTWVSLGSAGAGGPPSGAAGGDLTGSYPNPQILAGAVVDADVNAGAAIAQSKIANLVTDLGNKANASALANYQLLSGKGAASGYAGLDANGLIPTVNLPPLAINEVFTVASESAMLALPAQRGDMAIRTDNGLTYVLATDAPNNLADWKQVTAAGQVVSVNGKTGVVTITLTELGGVPTSRSVIAGNGLTGGGTLAADATLNVANADGTLTVGADDVKVASAPKWTTARSITLTGDATGSVASIDGTANISIPVTVVAKAKRYAANVGAGASVAIAHGLNTRDVDVQVYRNTSPWDTVICNVERTDVNTVTLKFASAVAVDAYRVVVLA